MVQKVVTWPLLAFTLIVVLVGDVGSDISQDKEKCTNQLIGLAPCLSYVVGEAKIPTPDCCSGLNEVMVESKECVCLLIQFRNDPGLGLKVNVTMALSIPLKCHSPDPNLDECPAILHLPANSSDAKSFQEFERSLKGNNSTSNATTATTITTATTSTVNGPSSSSGKGSSTNIPSKGKRKTQFQNEMALVLLVALFFTSIIINNNA